MVVWDEVQTFHIAQQMPLPLTISCSSKSRLVLTCLVLPFWYLLTRVVPDIFQKSSQTVMCVCVDIGVSADLELMDKFCYLGDILSVDGDTDVAVEARIRIGWNKFRQLVPLLTTHTHNHFTAVLILSGTTWESLYQNKHSPTHTYGGHQLFLSCFLHLL